MEFEFIAYLILFYTALAIVLSVYLFIVFMDWFKRSSLVNHVRQGSTAGVEKY